MERNKRLKIIQAVNTELSELERQRNVYLNLLHEDISKSKRNKCRYRILGRTTGGSIKWKQG
jgi:hypothetical protein